MLKCTFCLFIPKDKAWKNQQQNGRACSQAMISLISTILLQSNKLLSHKDAGILFQMSMHTD